MKTAVKKENDLEKFVPGRVNEEQEIQVEDNQLEGLLRHFQYLFVEKEFVQRRKEEAYIAGIEDILPPSEIDRFLGMTAIAQDERWYGSKAGRFVQKLVENSYEAGYDKFTFVNAQLSKIDGICKNVGTEGRVTEIEANAEVVKRFAERLQYGKLKVVAGKAHSIAQAASYSTIEINMTSGNSIAGGAWNSEILIKGSVEDSLATSGNKLQVKVLGNGGDRCGKWVKSSTFNVSGNVEDCAGEEAIQSHFKIGGDAGDNFGQRASSSTFSVAGRCADRAGMAAKKSKFVLEKAGDSAGHSAIESTFVIETAGRGLGMYAKDSIFVVDEVDEINIGLRAQNCVYETSNEETLEKLIEHVPLNNIVKFNGKAVRDDDFDFSRYQSTVAEVMEKYIRMIMERFREPCANLNDVLTAEEINQVARRTGKWGEAAYETFTVDERGYAHSQDFNKHVAYMVKTGHFINQLMRNSSAAGEKKISLDLPKPLSYLCERMRNSRVTLIGDVEENVALQAENVQVDLQGTSGSYFGNESWKCKFSVSGDVGYKSLEAAVEADVYVAGNVERHFGYRARDSNFVVEGNADKHFGRMGRNSTYEIKGDVTWRAGLQSKDCTYIIHGEAGAGLGKNAQRSVFYLHGKVRANSLGMGAKDCTFKTTHKGTLKKLLRKVPEGNQVVYIEDGKEEVIRNYGN